MRDEYQDRELSTADLADGASRSHADRRDEQITDREVDRGYASETGREGDGPAPLLDRDFVNDLQLRWNDVQTGFVDEPRRAVEQADSLVAEAIKQLAESFARERAQLEAQWDRGDDVSTEDLRQALQRYRSFFTRLLSV